MLTGHFPEIAVGGGDDSGVKVDDTVAAHMDDLLFLNGSQQLGLHGQAHGVQFVHTVDLISVFRE